MDPSTHTHTHKTVLRPFFQDYRVSRYQKKSSSGLHGASEDNRGRHTNHLPGRHSIQTNQHQPPLSLHFYRPHALPAAQATVSKH